MNLHQLYLKKNECYITGDEMTPKGIMWHCTGANNPTLKRYVGPNDGLLGENKNNNHWNQFRPEGRQVCVHAFIGKLENGSIATYQTLPWNYVGWHCGGKGNQSYIGFEICEDGLTDKNYFEKVYQEAVELTAYLCKAYNLNPKGKDVIICHQDGYKLGLASNHSDVYNWFNKFGKTMDDVRNDVAKLLISSAPVEPSTPSGNIKVGDTVSIKSGATYYTGASIPNWVLNDKWIVKSVNGDRVVIDKNSNGSNSICSIIKSSYLTIIKSEDTTNKVETFKVQVTIDDLNIRKGPGVEYNKIGKFTGKGVFTIVDTKSGSGCDSVWGLLKSYEDKRDGWISLDFAKRL